jgi:hypothetical protein
MFNPLAFSSSAALQDRAAEVCGCGCSGVVAVQVDDWIIIAF